ncbi:MAG: glycine betaine ABC transporter substrate-binding protein [Planctomycetota bacterium]
MRRWAAWIVLAFVVVTAGVLAAVGLRAALVRPDVVVGSKSFTESVILGEIAAERARRAGLTTEHKASIRGTRLVYEAVRSGAVDVYAEYTGTLAQEIFADRDIESMDDLRAALAEASLAMTEPIGFNNTYAIGVMPETARRLGLRTTSDLRNHPDLTLGFTNEFIEREDGWGALRGAYGLPQADVKGLDHDLAYRALASGAIDAKELYTTDAKIAALGLVVLEDDRGHFPRYDAVWLYNADLERRRPEMVAALHAMTGILDEAAMVRLNARTEIDGVEESVVARGFLAELLDETRDPAGAPAESRTARLLETTREHAVMVAASMLAAIALAVPLGVLAARSRLVGQIVLGASGLLQTIPSIAILALLVSLLAMANQFPAIVALFLYSLLPIVRNTHAGLVQIPRAVRDSAQSLGLPRPWTLLDVELPLALPSILAGIKTAIVINVGTATLGGFVAAGGYGEPIFAGIRRDDAGLILEGLVPAALMAIVLTLLLDALEFVLVPRGLRATRAG